MKRLSFMVLLFCLFRSAIQAQDTMFISLENVLQQVEVNYPSLLQHQFNIQAMQRKAEGAKAWMPPVLSGGLMRFPYNLSMLRESMQEEKYDPMNQAGIAFSVEQMIPNPAKLNARKAYLTSLEEAEKSKAAWTKNQLRRDTKILYYYRYTNEQKLIVLQKSEGILATVLSAAEARFSTSQTSLQTIYKAKARLAEVKKMQSMLHAAIAESTIGINVLMLREPHTPFRIDSLIEPGKYSTPIYDATGISERSDISAMDKAIQSMVLEQKLIQTDLRPDFGIRAEHAQMFGMPNQWTLMGMVTIPMVPWSAGMTRSEARSMSSRIMAMEQEKKTMEQMAKKMLAENVAMLHYESEQYKLYQKEVIPAWENNMKANLLAYRQNTGTLFELLDAWDMLLMKQLEMYDKLYILLKAEASYEYEKEIR